MSLRPNREMDQLKLNQYFCLSDGAGISVLTGAPKYVTGKDFGSDYLKHIRVHFVRRSRGVSIIFQNIIEL